MVSLPNCCFRRRAIPVSSLRAWVSSTPFAQTRQNVPVVRRTAGKGLPQFARHPDVTVHGKTETGGQHPHHGDVLVFNIQLEVGEVRLATQVLRPISVTHQRNGSGVEVLVLRGETSPQHRLHTQHGEEITRNRGGHGARGFGGPSHGFQPSRVFRYAVEGLTRRPHVSKIRVGKIHVSAVAVHFVQFDEAVRLGVGQRPQ